MGRLLDSFKDFCSKVSSPWRWVYLSVWIQDYEVFESRRTYWNEKLFPLIRQIMEEAKDVASPVSFTYTDSNETIGTVIKELHALSLTISLQTTGLFATRRDMLHEDQPLGNVLKFGSGVVFRLSSSGEVNVSYQQMSYKNPPGMKPSQQRGREILVKTYNPEGLTRPKIEKHISQGMRFAIECYYGKRGLLTRWLLLKSNPFNWGLLWGLLISLFASTVVTASWDIIKKFVFRW